MSDARDEVFQRLSWAEHEGRCPANHQRVHGKGPCECGIEKEAEELIAAIRAEAQREQAALVKALEEFADHGTRRAIPFTEVMGDPTRQLQFYRDQVAAMDQYVRDAAARALRESKGAAG
jgi:hypothetical protein